MRVLVVIGSLRRGGAERQVANLLKSWARRPGLSVTLVLLERAAQVTYEVPPCMVVERLRAPGHVTWMRMMWRLRVLVREHDITYSWLDVANCLCLLAALGVRRPLVWAIRASGPEESLLSRVAFWVGALLSSNATALLANSARGLKRYRDAGYRTAMAAVIGNGIDIRTFHPDSAAPARLRERLGVPAETQLLGCVARYHPVKRHALLLRAFAHAANTTSLVHWHLVLVGQGVTHDNTDLQGVAAEAGTCERLHLLGDQARVEKLIAGFDAVVCASEHEGFPNAVAEGMACGVPVVCTDVGDARQLIADAGVCCGLDEGEVAEALRAIMQLSEIQRRALGRRGRIRIEEEYSLEALGERTLAFLATAAGAASASPNERNS